MPESSKEKPAENSAKVLLDFAYFIESEQTQDLSNLLQRLAIIMAADAALIGLWGNLIVQIIPRLKGNQITIILLGISLFIPLVILGVSLLLSAIAILYRPHVSIDPNQIISDRYYNGPTEIAMREIASSYRRDWVENQPIRQRRSKLFNASLYILLIGLLWILKVLAITFFFVERS